MVLAAGPVALIQREGWRTGLRHPARGLALRRRIS